MTDTHSPANESDIEQCIRMLLMKRRQCKSGHIKAEMLIMTAFVYDFIIFCLLL